MQINRQSYEEYFLLYVDGELNPSEKRAVEAFVALNPDLEGELKLLRETVFSPDTGIQFDNKELLLKEEEDRKVFGIRWFRMAAAAAILIAFTITGWLYLGVNRMNKVQPVAVVTKPAPAPVSKQDEKAVVAATPKVTSKQTERISAVKTREKSSGTTNKKQNEVAVEKSVQPSIKESAPTEEIATSPIERIPEHAIVSGEVIMPEQNNETVDMPVTARAVESNASQEQEISAEYATSFTKDPENDMIYFANTSLSKKTKLRGVLRKASRYLDRVTSLQ